MNKQVKVSVIVPVYNMEQYLRQCLDSIIGQTLRDIEIILVNDGSTDTSPEIMREYAARDKRIKIMDKPNEGYGRTMNCGIDAATGKYIGIVESDDWIESDMYEQLHTLADKNDAEVVKCCHFHFDGKKTRASTLPADDVGRIINPKKNPKIFFVGPSIWAAIYRADFLRNNDIRFLESPGASYQDTGFNFKVWASAQRAYLTMKPLLHYRTGHESQSVKSKNNVFCVCDEFAEIDRWMKKYHPQWIPAFEKVYNYVKKSSYGWNLKRLAGGDKIAFMKRYRAELSDAARRNAIDTSHMHSKAKAKFNMRINPTLWNKIKYALIGNVLRLFIKNSVCNEYMIYFLFLIIPVWKRKITVDGVIVK